MVAFKGRFPIKQTVLESSFRRCFDDIHPTSDPRTSLKIKTNTAKKTPVLFTRRQVLKYGLRGLAAFGVAKGFYNTNASQVLLNKVDVRIKALPAAFNGFTIGLLSDLHSSFIVSKDLITSAAGLLMKQRPDLIALTGDFVTGSTKFLSGSAGEFKQENLSKCVDALSGIKARFGVYGVLGNHDFWSGKEAVRAITTQFTKNLGVVWLRNRAVEIEKGAASISLLGVDDYWEAGSSLPDACKGLGKEDVRILLSHNPDINEEIELSKERIDLVLSGHTHGGQIVVPFIGQPIMPSKFGQKYRIGLVRDGGRQTFVTTGVGHLLFPIRLNCPPEAALIRLVS